MLEATGESRRSVETHNIRVILVEQVVVESSL